MEEPFAQEQWEKIDGDDDLRYYLVQILEQTLDKDHRDKSYCRECLEEAETEEERERCLDMYGHPEFHKGWRSATLHVASLLDMEYTPELEDHEGS